MGRIIPYIKYIMENKSYVWNHQPVANGITILVLGKCWTSPTKSIEPVVGRKKLVFLPLKQANWAQTLEL